VRIDLNKRSVDMLIGSEEFERRMAELKKKGGYPVPESQTPWQEMFRDSVDELSNGMVLKPAVKYQRIAQTKGVPRDNH
jgi:dihydroxy-acid dehydratase